MDNVLRKLEGGDRRSIGRVKEVVEDVVNDPSLFGAIFNGMLSNDPVIRMRSADAVEKITLKHPEYLQPYKKRLIQRVAKSKQQEVRWHAGQMFPRLDLSEKESKIIVEILLDYLDDKNKIVKTFSMQALADLAEKNASLRSQVISILQELSKTGSAAIKNRRQKLLKKWRSSVPATSS